eukprot:3401575-Amphidinium_carterae.1
MHGKLLARHSKSERVCKVYEVFNYFFTVRSWSGCSSSVFKVHAPRCKGKPLSQSRYSSEKTLHYFQHLGAQQSQLPAPDHTGHSKIDQISKT